jgi:hypothetical protein
VSADGRMSDGCDVTAAGAHDQGFVPSPPDVVYPILADVDGYPAWWPGARVWGRDPDLLLQLPRAPRVVARVDRVRPGVGLFLRLDPPMEGALEWYLEPFEEGTVVNCLLQLDLEGGPRAVARRLKRLRAGVHQGLAGLELRLR